ncbi:MAG: alcohol dehydrogenase catalytic domain-containing protein [Candidatus Doudnabacteria bacterium]|nr:alcohol dehydrogenase catalytic domain-containing protein [Candidatus Doudnabacteria bacterium]
MKAAIFSGPGKIEVREVPDPAIQNADDAIVRITHACICGSDLWPYRGLTKRDAESRIGHEFMGIVEEAGDGVKNVKVGDLVVAPFVISDGTCPECRLGMTTRCRNMQSWGAKGNDGGQGEKIRVPLANGTLFAIPKNQVTEQMMPALLPLSDVLCTGHHAAVSAGVRQGSTVAVIGDGAVGLCAVAASKRLGASRIFHISTHKDRAAIGRKFGATDTVAARGEEAAKQIKDATDNLGVDCALECVGTAESWNTAFSAVRAGGNIGAVGLPVQVPDIPVAKIFWPNIGVKGSAAPAASYIPVLLSDVLSGKLDVSDIFTKTIPLSDVAQGYKDMDERREIKVLIKM